MGVYWTNAKDRQLVNMVELKHASWKSIEKHFGRSASVCARRYYKITGSRACEVHTVQGKREKPDELAVARAERASQLRLRRDDECLSSGNVTALVFGDPLPGRSALDKKRAREMRA